MYHNRKNQYIWMKTTELQIGIYKIVTFVLQGKMTLSSQSAIFDHGFQEINEMEDFYAIT